MAQSVKFQLRRDTALNWATNNPVLFLGEPGYAIPDGSTGSTGGNRMKIGNGTTGWNSLPYLDGGSTGPTGPGVTGPTGPGVTGPTGPGMTGPTGPGMTGPTGPGITGPTGEGGTGVAQSSWDPVAVPPTNVRIGPTGGSFTKINGLVAGYDTAIRSAQAYLSGCYVSFNSPSDTSGNTPGGGVTGTEATFGISSIPNPIGNTGVALTDIQYGINYNASGTTYGWYESGTYANVPGGCAPGDSFSILYDGTNVNYYHQNTLVRSVARAAGQTGAFHLEGNFQNYGTINNLVFGPLVSKSPFSGYTSYAYNASPQTITIPANVIGLDAILIGGGGGGGGGGGANSCGGGGGGAGYIERLNLTPQMFGLTGLGGVNLTYAVGIGGTGNSDEGGAGLRGQDGGSTYIIIDGVTYEAPGGEGAGPGNGGGGGGGGGNGGSGGGGGGGSVTGGIGGYGQMTIYDGYDGTTTDIKGGIGGRSPFGTNFFTLPRPVKNPAVNGGCGGGWLGGWSNTTGAGGASSSKGYDGYGSGGGGRNADPGPGGISPEGNNGGNGGLYIRYYTV